MNIDLIAIFIVKIFVGAIESFLGIRFFLKILGASQEASFVRWIYITSDSFLDPFRGMFPTLSMGPYFVVELSTLFAMLVYALVGFVVIKIIDFIYHHIVEEVIGPSKPQPQQDSKPAQQQGQIFNNQQTPTEQQS